MASAAPVPSKGGTQVISVRNYPLYAVDITRRGHVAVAGGGGKGRHGVPNTLVGTHTHTRARTYTHAHT